MCGAGSATEALRRFCLLRLHFAGGGGGDGGDGGRGEDELELRLDLGELCCEEVEQHDLRQHEHLWPAREAGAVHSSGEASGACLTRAGDVPSDSVLALA